MSSFSRSFSVHHTIRTREQGKSTTSHCLHIESFPRIFSENYQNIPRIFSEYSQNIIRIFSEYYQNILRILSEYSQIIIRIFSEYSQNILRIFWEYCENILRMLSQNILAIAINVWSMITSMLGSHSIGFANYTWVLYRLKD